jgi:hypothetical protein
LVALPIFMGGAMVFYGVPALLTGCICALLKLQRGRRSYLQAFFIAASSAMLWTIIFRLLDDEPSILNFSFGNRNMFPNMPFFNDIVIFLVSGFSCVLMCMLALPKRRVEGKWAAASVYEFAAPFASTLFANHDLTLNAGQNTYDISQSNSRSQTGLMNNGGLSVLIGNRRTDRIRDRRWLRQWSTISSNDWKCSLVGWFPQSRNVARQVRDTATIGISEPFNSGPLFATVKCMDLLVEASLWRQAQDLFSDGFQLMDPMCLILVKQPIIS